MFKSECVGAIRPVFLNKDVYLEVQYRLLRHEGVEPIRKAVQVYRSTLEMAESTDTCIYTDVFVRGVNIIRLGVMDRRLVPGTIVTLSPVLDNFQTRCVVAVVTAATTGRYNELIDWPMTPPPLDLEVPNAKITAGLMEPDQERIHRPTSMHIPIQGEITNHMQSKARLHRSQMLTLQRMITKELAIILLNMQPSNVSVIVTGRKNNSVDKLLIRCIKLDVDFVRLGGQAKGEAVTGRTLSNLRMQYQGKKWRKDGSQKRLDFLRSQTKLHLKRYFPSNKQQSILPESFREVDLISAKQCDCIMEAWEGIPESTRGQVARHPLGTGVEVVVSEPRSSEGAAACSKKEQLTGKSILISRWNSMKFPVITKLGSVGNAPAKRLLDENSNLSYIALDYRGIVYQHLECHYIMSSKLTLCVSFKQINEVEDVDIIRKSSARIIGCTTIGLTKYRSLIAALQPRLMTVEEAAKTCEANIAAALFPYLQQMILVGDHMQLASHADVLELSKPPFNLNVQRRMVPDVRKLLNAGYPLLVDHPCIKDQGPVPGMKVNAFKAAMIIGLYEYLVLNGSVPPDITIPTFYSGQKSCIESSLRRKESILGPEVQTMDGCQGKEKDLILVSITRSPEDRSKPDAGFLKDLRRVIVALSRPCRLLVVLDDTQVLLASSARSSWSKVLDRMKGPPKGYILVFCEAHGREIRNGPCKPALSATITDGSTTSGTQTSSEFSITTGFSALSAEEDLIEPE
ncbi:helicase required for RNAi-mediated heterochromatin assembly 1 [Colletotrichum incanum]|nr:helicase required for RNAi-mediated heterochromatin assembly 1 [Colletotrichum incanum]